MMLKKHMTPLGKRGQLVKTAGKGERPMPMAGMFNNSNPGSKTMNDYAKATPMANPTPPDMPEIPT